MYQTPEHWFQPSALVLLVFSVAVAAVACCSCPWWRCRGCPFFPCKFESFAQNQLLCSIKRFSSEFLLESLYRYFVQLMQPKNVTLCCCCCTQPFISFLPGKTWILSLFQKKSRVYRCKTHKAKKKIENNSLEKQNSLWSFNVILWTYVDETRRRLYDLLLLP